MVKNKSLNMVHFQYEGHVELSNELQMSRGHSCLPSLVAHARLPGHFLVYLRVEKSQTISCMTQVLFQKMGGS